MMKFIKSYMVKKMLSEPVIFTTKGNIPISQLQCSVRWEDGPEYTKLVETYTLNGEVVRESAHVLSRQSMALGVEQGGVDG